jgi:hypothetical protein
VQRDAPEGLARSRWEQAAGSAPTAPATGGQEARLFSGSSDAVARSQAFTGPGPDVVEPGETGGPDRRDEAQTRPIAAVEPPDRR